MRDENRYHIDMRREPVPLFVRTGAFLRHPDAELVVPRKLRLCWSRLSHQLFWLFRVSRGTYSITTPYGHAHILRRSVRKGERLYIKLQHILAFSESMFPAAQWKIDLSSLLTRQLRYVYLQGPGNVYLFGLGGLRFERIHFGCGPVDFDQGAVLGFCGNLRVGVSTRSSLSAALFAWEDICLDRFVGEGVVLTQASTAKHLPASFHDQGANSSLVDYVNALLGVRM